MPVPNFPHLQLLERKHGSARFSGGGSDHEIAKERKKDRASREAHSDFIVSTFSEITNSVPEVTEARRKNGLPVISGGIPFLLRVPEDDDAAIDFLAETLGLELVAEHDEGYVLVSSGDLDLNRVENVANEFINSIRGSAKLADILEIETDPLGEERLERILDQYVYEYWPFDNDKEYTFDVSIECALSVLPKPPNITEKTRANVRERKEAEYTEALERAMREYDTLRIKRETEIEDFVRYYDADILDYVDGDGIAVFPDSFSARITMSGAGFTDLIANFPSLFEVSFPDDVEMPSRPGVSNADTEQGLETVSPSKESSKVCVIDSGIQEAHPWLAHAILPKSSRCFLPGSDPTDTADYVSGGGHGTRVAGAVLFPEAVPRSGKISHPFWLVNARVLDENNKLPETLYPPAILESVISHYITSENVRIFNHSINSSIYAVQNRMSAWAAAIDNLSFNYDALVIQSVGNIPPKRILQVQPGILSHLSKGRYYPNYLYRPSSRLANPAQSLQAITVGSISGASYNSKSHESIADAEEPSSFSRSGFGLWDSIKPDVVEVGGDFAVSKAMPHLLVNPSDLCPELLRSTLHGGPPFDKDDAGTSYSTPKVAHIAGVLSNLFPDSSTMLYRALIINSARWPEWAENADRNRRNNILRSMGYGLVNLERATENSLSRVTLITEEEYEIAAKEALIFSVPIPDSIRLAQEEFKVRIDVTLSYVAEPRRTRQNRKKYLGVWLDWISSQRGESLENFIARALVENGTYQGGANLPWMLGNNLKFDGLTEGVYRRGGTAQKDWAILENHEFPEELAIAVRGHVGWDSRNRDARARFCLAVTLEAMDIDLPIYTEIEQEIESQVRAQIRLE